MATRKISVTEVASRLGVSAGTVRRWCDQGMFPNARQIKEVTVGSGFPWLIPESDLKGFKPPKTGRPLSLNPSDAALKKRKSRAS